MGSESSTPTKQNEVTSSLCTAHMNALRAVYAKLSSGNSSGFTQTSFESHCNFPPHLQNFARSMFLSMRRLFTESGRQTQNFVVFRQFVHLVEIFLLGSPREQSNLLFNMFSRDETLDLLSFERLVTDMIAIAQFNHKVVATKKDEQVVSKSYQNFVSSISTSLTSKAQFPLDSEKFVDWFSKTIPSAGKAVGYLLWTKFLSSNITSREDVVKTGTQQVSLWPPPFMDVSPSFLPTPDIIGWLLSSVIDEPQSMWEILFSAGSHGCSFGRLAAQVAGYGAPTVLLIRTEKKEIFGAYVSVAWHPRSSHYKDSNSFLFSLLPNLAIYRSVGENNFYFYDVKTKFSNIPQGIGFGGRLEHFRLFVTNDLSNGYATGIDSTYERGKLSSETNFNISNLEIWGMGGKEAKEKQIASRKAREEQMSKRKVNAAVAYSGGNGWEDGADKFIMDLAGITGSSSAYRESKQVVEENSDHEACVIRM
eukprot:TRINITY_DN12370_c0_g1_i2.p1 TRINITY_DN12370_c0_g1~~TRINITY_DN12370_c0_g1_i2.p1  ORF type:complete len:478 (+),score=81.56 TRINITY_DN12370_c0_g1_i2:336-1769(+)